MKDASVKLFSLLHTTLYRATGGAIGRRLVNNDMLLLTTSGRSTGARHTVPLLYLREGERFVVIASYGGRPHHPEWYLNLLTQPDAMVQTERTTTPVIATTMSTADRDIWWPRIVTAYADYANYQSRTERQIPVVWLDPRTEDSE
ncbi:MAG: nitroreductase family deazaflavin-dependent oxidoreductase [Acidimicrobiia bacterium]